MSFRDRSEEDWEETIHGSRHTYYPVCSENLDDVTGILDTKDYFRSGDKSRASILKHAVDQPYFVPETMKANVLFRKMKENRIYFAVVLDEYGGVSGIITLHDLMESLVGEINEREEPWKPEDIAQTEDGRWRIQGYALLDDVADALHMALPVETYDTFSGYVCGLIGRVPADKEQFSCEAPGMLVQVLEVENHMIGETLVETVKK